MHSPSTADITTDLVRLRRWAIAQLRRRNDPAAESLSWLGSVAEDTWSLFLVLERCASPLLAVILEGGMASHVPAAGMSLLKTEAARETESVLRAERDARWIASFSRDSAVRPIALKGLLPAIAEASPPLHLFDLDILASDADSTAIAANLQAAGFTAATDNEIHHVYWAPPPGHLPVELHRTVFSTGAALSEEAWARVTTVSDLPGMYRLAYADQMHHMLHHALVQHTDRHVRIRDLLLMSWVISKMDEEDHRQLQALIDSLPISNSFYDFLNFAETFRDSGEAGGSIVDPYEDDAILFFAATLFTRDSAMWNGGPNLAWQGAASVAAGRNTVTELTRFAGKNPVTGIRAFSSLQRKTPAAGQAITRVGRAALYFTSATLGSPVLLAIRREVTRRLNSPLSSR